MKEKRSLPPPGEYTNPGTVTTKAESQSMEPKTLKSMISEFILLLTHGRKQKRVQSTQSCPFTSLPTEIVLQIFDQLPLSTQASLALTCKVIYEDVGYILKDDRLSWPNVLNCKIWPVPLNLTQLQRNHLLAHIEDDKWLYCSRCTKLHPRDWFKKIDPGDDPSQRRCIHRKVDLKQWLRTGNSDGLPEKIRGAFTPVTANKTLSLIHCCPRLDRGCFFLDLTITLVMGLFGPLELQYRYDVHLVAEQGYFDEETMFLYQIFSVLRRIDPIPFCPHVDVQRFILSQRPYTKEKCSPCSAVLKIMVPRDGETNFVIQGVRSLGKMTKEITSEWCSTSRKDAEEQFRWL
ncbi:hypothetical protein P170DRAFT_468943 [Aspergillus steynii IBT 23096]|uniref:F-box domain-containing protein n=1 Tax=Aspergillus steynii IBT 23096 TaxID=1392250 RepID=A0A2I2FRN2_9EURO|nr:uncharacterized protein P170DRAFT_468943 [Aspergillus steynii IBT 23096]PLB43290.1 hypothetical protein P170DRAFT_468943 [Aspergillus steynii IBT 23096]